MTSPLFFPGLWTGGEGDQGAEIEQSSLVLWSMDWRRGTQEQRERAVLSCSLVYGLEEGDPEADSEQSSLVLWSMDWSWENPGAESEQSSLVL